MQGQLGKTMSKVKLRLIGKPEDRPCEENSWHVESRPSKRKIDFFDSLIAYTSKIL